MPSLSRQTVSYPCSIRSLVLRRRRGPYPIYEGHIGLSELESSLMSERRTVQFFKGATRERPIRQRLPITFLQEGQVIGCRGSQSSLVRLDGRLRRWSMATPCSPLQTQTSSTRTSLEGNGEMFAGRLCTRRSAIGRRLRWQRSVAVRRESRQSPPIRHSSTT